MPQIKSYDTLSDVKEHIKRGVILSKGSNLTIASGVITVTDSFHLVHTEGTSVQDNLTTINSAIAATPGQMLVLMAADDGDTVVVTNSASIRIGDNIHLNSDSDHLTLMWTGSKWVGMAYGHGPTDYSSGNFTPSNDGSNP